MRKATLTILVVTAAWLATAAGAPAAVRPGVMTYTGANQCTANFVFRGGDGSTYIGQSAHCAGTSADLNGCTAPTLPLGSTVDIQGAQRAGELAYSSFRAMQELGERDANACYWNDFALVKLHRDEPVDPTVPVFGGPTGLRSARPGEVLTSYQNSGLRGGEPALSPKFAFVLATGAGGWMSSNYTLTPGIPGDSGSGYLGSDGAAVGVLTTIEYANPPLGNGVTDLPRALIYANAHGAPGVSLVHGRAAGAARRRATRAGRTRFLRRLG